MAVKRKLAEKRRLVRIVLISVAGTGLLVALVWGLFAIYVITTVEGELSFFIKRDYFPDYHEKYGRWPTSLAGFVDYCKAERHEEFSGAYLSSHPKLVLIDNQAKTFRAELDFNYGYKVTIDGDTTLDR